MDLLERWNTSENAEQETADVPTVPSPWIPPSIMMRKGILDVNKETSAVQILWETLSILNKITPTTFDQLGLRLNEALLWPEKDNDIITDIVTLVLKKSYTEHLYTQLYAKMMHNVCRNMSSTGASQFRKQIVVQAQMDFMTRKMTVEKSMKLAKEEFSKLSIDNDNVQERKLELEEVKYLTRLKALGNVRFLGELYKVELLTLEIMTECIQQLLLEPDDDDLERLCVLLTTVGKWLEMDLSDINKSVLRGERPKFIPQLDWMENLFGVLHRLSESPRLSSLLRFKILTVLELRENDWNPRRVVDGPTVIEQQEVICRAQTLEKKGKTKGKVGLVKGKNEVSDAEILLATEIKNGAETLSNLMKWTQPSDFMDTKLDMIRQIRGCAEKMDELLKSFVGAEHAGN